MEKQDIVYTIVDSPIGKFVAAATKDGCCCFEFMDRGDLGRIGERLKKRYGGSVVPGSNRHIRSMIAQVTEYFEGARKEFSLTLDVRGTPFEQAVWKKLRDIPYGSTTSYGQIATALGKPGASRAVGRANGANYLPIIIPCHRVIEADGSLRGYGGGLWRKQFLLDLESGRGTAPDLFGPGASSVKQ